MVLAHVPPADRCQCRAEAGKRGGIGAFFRSLFGG
jgi:hypothetical protein